MPFKTLAKVGAKKKLVVPAKKKPVSVFDIVMENIATRRSVRCFTEADVPIEDLAKLMEAAHDAPSAENRQPWEFIVVRDKDMKKNLAKAADGQKFLTCAPVIIVACVNVKISGSVAGERGLKLYGIQDVACATENLLLAANALGLGTCWVGDFSESEVSQLLRCPPHIRPCALIALGWPAEAPKMPARHEAADFVHLEHFGATARKQFAWGHAQNAD